MLREGRGGLYKAKIKEERSERLGGEREIESTLLILGLKGGKL